MASFTLNNKYISEIDKDDKIVISGISGIFPKSDNVLEFKENLYNKVDMVTREDSSSCLNDFDVPKYQGKINNINKFDASFFKINFHLACVVDPMSRILLEHVYAAIFDSGTNSLDLKGKRVGVFVGVAYNDGGTFITYNVKKRSVFAINGTSKAKLANRVSYWLDGKGPSYAMDVADASSIACLEQAYIAINTGQCDAAVVAGCNLCVFPKLSLNIKKAGLLCSDGKTKCFDRNADGYVRSDAVGVVFLQKAKHAKRIYTELCHVKGIYGIKDDAKCLPMTHSKNIEAFMNEFYSEANVDSKEVEYIEAQGSAIAKADKDEMVAINEVFAKDRSIKIGCVKSNMGCSEAASGICALTKLCLLYHTGQIPANLHYSDPQNISAIREKRLQIVTENTSFNRGYTALNNFSFTGTNFHVLLKGMYKAKDSSLYQTAIPRLILASGRQENSVNKIFDHLKNNPIDPEQIGLLHNVFRRDIPGHTSRGYTILDTNENKTITLGQKAEFYSGEKRPLWFVYSGMGSQWATMGADLMKIPIFADAIHKCNDALKSTGIDLIHILTTEDKTIFDNPIHAFVGIGAVQIGLTDILKAMGVEPDYIIGHSLGETACGYQDGGLTKEELILCTYSRALICINAKLIRGTMAAVGLGYKSVVSKCPPEVDVACHNSSTTATLSGPEEVMKQFIDKLSEQSIFCKEVPCGNVAYHSRYVTKCGPELLKRLKEVIPNPKLRSKRWISTSVPQDKWDDPVAKFASAEYYTNNLLQPVFFEEASRMIPDNAIVVEIAPHGLLQAILKRSHKNCTHIPLAKRGCSDGVTFLLEAIGGLYMNGIQPQIEVLYPKIEYPVSTETALLSHLVEWEHSEDWPTPNCEDQRKITAQARKVTISILDDNYSYLEGHILKGRTVLPEAAILVLIWETLSMYKEVDYRYQSIIFKNITFHSQVQITREKLLKLYIMINKGNDCFEVVQDDQIIASGAVIGAKVIKLHHDVAQFKDEIDEIILTADDIYKILTLRGYSYSDQFTSIHSTNLSYNKAYVKWTTNWVTFLDSLIQMCIISRNTFGISIPKYIQKIRINVFEHENVKPVLIDEVECYNAEFNKTYDVIRCAGVEIDTVIFKDINEVDSIPDIIEQKSFFPYYAMGTVDINTALKIYLQIITENTYTDKLRVTPFLTTEGVKIYNTIQEFCNNNLIIKTDVKIYIEKEINYSLLTENHLNTTNIVVFENLLYEDKKILDIHNVLIKGEFVIAIEHSIPKLDLDSVIRDYFTIISTMSNGDQIFILLKKIELIPDVIYVPIKFDIRFSWVKRVYDELKTTKRVVLISEKQAYSGLLGFVKNLRKKGFTKLSLFVIDDFHAPTFNPDNDVYATQILKNLAINVLKKGQWGGYYYTSTEKTKPFKNAILTSFNPGDLESLKWVEAPTVSNNNIVQVYFAGLSLRDSEKAAGVIKSNKNDFGMDFSGINSDGNRVMGVIANGALRSTVECDSHLLWPVPVHWSMEDAATVPLPYLQAYYCLTIRSQLRRNHSVLITGGAGALGQAVITLCLALDCSVYATVNSPDKKEFLLKLFPQLNGNNVGHLADDSFLSMIRNNTAKVGCDFVINCCSGTLREMAMKFAGCIAIFLDLNFYDMQNNHNIGMYFLDDDKSYKAIDVSNVFKPENVMERKLLQTAISEGIAKGIVRPLSRIIYSHKDIVKAFRLISFNKNKGRVVIKMRDALTAKEGFDVIPRINFSATKFHLIVCDKNGIGIEVADRLVKSGASRIVLNMPQRFATGYVHKKIESWMKEDVTIKISNENLSTENGCNKILIDISKMGQLAGIFVVQDARKVRAVEELPEQFNEELNKFGLIVNNLDISTRNDNVSYFVIIVNKSRSDSQRYSSSLAERICQTRNEIGLPALVIHNTNEDVSSWSLKELSELFSTMEIGIKLKYTNIRSFILKKESSLDFMRNISNVLGFKIEDIDVNSEIGELKLNEALLEQLKCLVKNAYNIDVTVEKIQHMTIDSLSKIGDGLIKKNTDFNSGMRAFYKVVDSEYDHVSVSQYIVPMITLLNNGIETNIDPKATHLTMIPGFEGRHDVFNQIAERLKINAVSIQLDPDICNENSIRHLAHGIRKHMKSKFVTQSKFYLLGYSFGVNIALEVASILENEGHVGVVYCLDSSPEVLKSQIRAYVGDLKENELENAVIEHIYFLMAGHRYATFSEELYHLSSFTEKLELFTKLLKGRLIYSNEYKKLIIETACNRIRSAFEYKTDMKLASEIVLIKGIPHPNSAELSEDYGLSEFTNKPVKVFTIESDHAMAPYDCRVSSIINKTLDENLLEEFKNRNLCDVYLDGTNN